MAVESVIQGKNIDGWFYKDEPFFLRVSDYGVYFSIFQVVFNYETGQVENPIFLAEFFEPNSGPVIVDMSRFFDYGYNGTMRAVLPSDLSNPLNYRSGLISFNILDQNQQLIDFIEVSVINGHRPYDILVDNPSLTGSFVSDDYAANGLSQPDYIGFPHVKVNYLANPDNINIGVDVEYSVPSEGQCVEAVVCFRSQYGGLVVFGFDNFTKSTTGSYDDTVGDGYLDYEGDQYVLRPNYSGITENVSYNLRISETSKQMLEVIKGIERSTNIYLITSDNKDYLIPVRLENLSVNINTYVDGGSVSLNVRELQNTKTPFL